jgi:hypothetical protein
MRNHDRFSGTFALPACPYLQIICRHGPIWQRGGFGTPAKIDKKLEDMTGLSDLGSVMKKGLGYDRQG